MSASDWEADGFGSYDEFFDARIPWFVDGTGRVFFGDKGGLHDDLIADAESDGEVVAKGEVLGGSARQFWPLDNEYVPLAQEAWDDRDPEDGIRTWSSDWASDSQDLWSGPASTNLEQGVGVPGEAPGMGDAMDPQAPGHAGPDEGNWVYLNGRVGFGGPHWDLARDLALGQGFGEDEAEALGNSIARGHLPQHHDLAYGETTAFRGKKYPQVWLSTVDRNAVWDAVAEALAGRHQGAALWAPLGHRGGAEVAATGRADWAREGRR